MRTILFAILALAFTACAAQQSNTQSTIPDMEGKGYTYAPPRCLQPETSGARKVALTSAPGEAIDHHVRAEGQRLAEYHIYSNIHESEGYHSFVCPVRPPKECNRHTEPMGDEACVVYADCLEICRDPRSGKLLWP